MAGRARVASHLTSGKGGIPEDAGGYNACSSERVAYETALMDLHRSNAGKRGCMLCRGAWRGRT